MKSSKKTLLTQPSSQDVNQPLLMPQSSSESSKPVDGSHTNFFSLTNGLSAGNPSSSEDEFEVIDPEEPDSDLTDWPDEQSASSDAYQSNKTDSKCGNNEPSTFADVEFRSANPFADRYRTYSVNNAETVNGAPLTDEARLAAKKQKEDMLLIVQQNKNAASQALTTSNSIVRQYLDRVAMENKAAHEQAEKDEAEKIKAAYPDLEDEIDKMLQEPLYSGNDLLEGADMILSAYTIEDAYKEAKLARPQNELVVIDLEPGKLSAALSSTEQNGNANSPPDDILNDWIWLKTTFHQPATPESKYPGKPSLPVFSEYPSVYYSPSRHHPDAWTPGDYATWSIAFVTSSTNAVFAFMSPSGKEPKEIRAAIGSMSTPQLLLSIAYSSCSLTVNTLMTGGFSKRAVTALETLHEAFKQRKDRPGAFARNIGELLLGGSSTVSSFILGLESLIFLKDEIGSFGGDTISVINGISNTFVNFITRYVSVHNAVERVMTYFSDNHKLQKQVIEKLSLIDEENIDKVNELLDQFKLKNKVVDEKSILIFLTALDKLNPSFRNKTTMEKFDDYAKLAAEIAIGASAIGAWITFAKKFGDGMSYISSIKKLPDSVQRVLGMIPGSASYAMYAFGSIDCIGNFEERVEYIREESPTPKVDSFLLFLETIANVGASNSVQSIAKSVADDKDSPYAPLMTTSEFKAFFAYITQATGFGVNFNAWMNRFSRNPNKDGKTPGTLKDIIRFLKKNPLSTDTLTQINDLPSICPASGNQIPNPAPGKRHFSLLASADHSDYLACTETTPAPISTLQRSSLFSPSTQSEITTGTSTVPQDIKTEAEAKARSVSPEQPSTLTQQPMGGSPEQPSALTPPTNFTAVIHTLLPTSANALPNNNSRHSARSSSQSNLRQ